MRTLATLLREVPYDNDQKTLDPKLNQLISKINDIFMKIRECPNFEAAELYLALLEQIQTITLIIHLKNEKDVPVNLWQFSKDFDRIDDYETQQYLFEQIKNGQYKLL